MRIRKSYLNEIIILRVTENVTLVFYNEHIKWIKPFLFLIIKDIRRLVMDSNLDKLTSFFREGELTVIGGRPSMGKTSLALTIARTLSLRNGKKIVYFSLEMSKEQVLRRIISSETRLNCRHMINGVYSDEDEEINDISEKTMSAGLVIDDTPGTTIDTLYKKCTDYHKDSPIDLIIIDYLQLISGNGDHTSRIQEISAISGGLKELAKDLNVPVIVLTQISRAADGRKDHRPVLSDLRESESIIRNADTIMFLYRDGYYDKNLDDCNLSEVIIAKQKNPRDTNTIYLLWVPEYLEYRDYDGVYE